MFVVQWTLPEVTGMSPPPIAACSVNTLPTSNRAVLFGGVVIDDNGFHRSNDVYIITYTKNQVVSYTCNASTCTCMC